MLRRMFGITLVSLVAAGGCTLSRDGVGRAVAGTAMIVTGGAMLRPGDTSTSDDTRFHFDDPSITVLGSGLVIAGAIALVAGLASEQSPP